jgi:hypothetical protein
MFESKELNDHLKNSSTIKSQTAVIAEWNMNFSDNIADIGNYRYRPYSSIEDEKYRSLINFYDPRDTGNFYTDATDADIIVDGGFEEDGETPVLFKPKKEKEKLLFSLEECFGKFRPRSGINKLRYGITGNYLHHSNTEMFNRPRYYMPDKNDKFKYWTSYRTENGQEYGIAFEENSWVGIGLIELFGSEEASQEGIDYFIQDTAPYVVYKEEIPVNRIVIKTQTNVGDINLGPFSGPAGTFADPFFGEQNKTVPTKWKVQYLKNNIWIDAISFDKNSVRSNGSPIFGTDGYLELGYGLIVPEKFRKSFINNGILASTTVLPDESEEGQAYLVKANSSDVGIFYIWNSGEYKTFIPQYGWYVADENVDQLTNFLTDTTTPQKYGSNQNGILDYEEFTFISGIRIVVDTMNKFGATFDLIELSPRLAVDLTGKTIAYNLKKNASDLGISGLPVGQLLASTGSLALFDYDQSFNPNNTWNPDSQTGSVIAQYINKNIQIKFYEIISDIEITDIDNNIIKKTFYVPLKTMYSEFFPASNPKTRELSIELRDLFFYFESQTAPEILIPNTSLSYAVATIFDSIGFSNYSFKRIPGEPDPIIPYFFVAPDKSIAEVLQDLARSTQTAMFFDEYNNFIMMSKNYILPSKTDRESDLVLVGSKDQIKQGIVENLTNPTTPSIANIIDISSQDNNAYNDGKISYINRYIQKTMGSIKQAYVADKDINWIYKPSLLWEVSGKEDMKPTNGQAATANQYALSAIPLNSDLSSQIPEVVNHEIVNNIIDFGDGILYIGQYNGYFYSNGEVIKYDAVEYNVSVLPSSALNSGFTGGNVWITSPEEYENYFSKLSFNGKIYPTGRVRIYAEPNYETQAGVTKMSNGPVSKHGREQFGTKIAEHSAGLNQYWTNNDNVFGCSMDSKYLFGNSVFEKTTGNGKAGINKSLATKSSRSSLIKNYLSYSYNEEVSRKNKLSATSETVQSSALVMKGPSFSAQENSIDFISYVNKPLNNSFKHFGTRMRVVGKIENNETSVQTAAGATTYYNVPTATPEQSLAVSGGSGGIAALLNPQTNNGYYFEIAALSESNVDKYAPTDGVANVFFYKIVENQSYDKTSSTNLPGAFTTTTLTAQTNEALTIGGSAVSVGERIRLTNQTVSDHDGYYKVTAVGSATEKWLLTKDEAGIPVKLWSGLTTIIVDNGNFAGQSRVVAEENTNVYDLALEYQDFGSFRRFYLYINDTQVATVDDTKPLPIVNANNMALFVRGGSQCMFENIYALANNYSQNTSFTLDPVANSIFTNKIDISANESFRKYAISGIIQPTYLSGISPSEPPKYNIFYDEFGTIMREVAYFNVKYDKAYPALYATISPTFNKIRGYTVSGFFAGAYGAEFLIFNATDTFLRFDEMVGNYLRIQGITFTQDSRSELTVDDYFSKTSDFSNPQTKEDMTILSPVKQKELYNDVKNSRITYGRNEFSLDSLYIQSKDEATKIMEWIISKTMKPRKSVGVRIFATPTIQLGDIVTIDYLEADTGYAFDPQQRFVVYSIEHEKDISGPGMTIYLSEVI